MTRLWNGIDLESKNGFLLSCLATCCSLSANKYWCQFRFACHARGSYRSPEPSECKDQEEYCALLKKFIRRVELEIDILTKDSYALEKSPESIEGITEEQRGLLRDMKENIVPKLPEEKTAKERGEIVLQTIKDILKLTKLKFLDVCPVSYANGNRVVPEW